MIPMPDSDVASTTVLPKRNFAALRRVLLILLVASTVVPAVCFIGYAYFDHQRRFVDADESLDRLARIAQEQALKVFDLNTAMVSRVASLLDDSSDADIRSREPQLHRQLDEIAGDYSQVVSLSVFGRDGQLLASDSFSPPPPVTIADREDFQSARAVRPTPYFSLPFSGRVRREDIFTTAVGRSGLHGEFIGVISLALRRQYFSAFYRELTNPGSGFSLGLYRRDGAVLVQEANSGTLFDLSASEPILLAFRDNVLAGTVTTATNHGERFLTTYRKVGPYPIYVAVMYDTAVLASEWWRHMLVVGGVALIPCLVLWTLLLFAFGQLRAEELAWQRWHNEVALRLSAESANRELLRVGAMGNLVANVAHAFNNLLAVVSTNMALARQKGFTDVASQVVAVEEAALEAQSLAHRLMSVAKKQVLKPAVVNMTSWFDETREIIKAAVGEHVELVIEISDVWPVLVDPRDLQFAVVNIAVNARDALGERPRFVVTGKNTTIHAGTPDVPAGEYVMLSLSDNGAGMSDETQRRALEPFFTSRAGTAGTGLGLTQVRAMAEQAGGMVRLSSAVKQGTTVRLYFPRHSSPARVKRADVASNSNVASRENASSVLLVEDDIHVAAGVSAVLQTFGCEVQHEPTADDALRRLMSGAEYDIVLSDVQMPGSMNGIGLAEQVRAKWPRARVALITGYADELVRARKIGVPVFGKPFDVEELKDFILNGQQLA